MAKILDNIKGKELTINDKKLKWFRILLEGISKGRIPIDNVRASYKGKSEWVKVSFWCKAIRRNKEEKENGNSKAKESKG